MSVMRFMAVLVIFVVVTLGWVVLGGSIVVRTEMLDSSLSGEMASLWGPKVLAQAAPYWSPRKDGPRDGETLAPASSVITAEIEHANRYKGLLWYSTFSAKFEANYMIPPAVGHEGRQGFFLFPLPQGATTYDGCRVTIDGQPWPVAASDIAAGRLAIPISANEPHTIHVAYATGGQNAWTYCPSDSPKASNVSCQEGGDVVASGAVGQLRDFLLTVTTNFNDIDYPKGARSPSQPAAATPAGRVARWQFDDALTNQPMGVVMPHRVNAGPIAARMSFFAPVGLLFFFTVLFALVIIKRIPLHPMHYLFISGGFFAFHILMAYLADLVNIHAAFWICAAVSVLLVVSYMRLVVGVRFAVLHVAAAQLVYLVGFSYAFFSVGYTGLAITIGAIATLFVLMQTTGRVNWQERFQRRNGLEAARSPFPAAIPPPIPLQE